MAVTIMRALLLAVLLLAGCRAPDDRVAEVLTYLDGTGVGAEYVALGRELHAAGRIVVVPDGEMQDFLGHADREAGRIELAEELFTDYAMHERGLVLLDRLVEVGTTVPMSEGPWRRVFMEYERATAQEE